MILILPICFCICFAVELLLTTILFSYDVRGQMRHRTAYYWETLLACLFGIVQIAFSTISTVGVVVQLHSEKEVKWLEVVMMCNLQLSVGNKVSSS
jgi:hypothetical protein